jgi:hypothetical protein
LAGFLWHAASIARPAPQNSRKVAKSFAELRQVRARFRYAEPTRLGYFVGMVPPSLKILGQCQITPSGGTLQEPIPESIDLNTHTGLRSNDLPLLALLATSDDCPRLSCMSVVSPKHKTLIAQVQRDVPISPEQYAALSAASEEVNQAIYRLRTILSHLAGIPNPIFVRKARDFRGSLSLSSEHLEIDYRQVRATLEGQPSLEAPGPAIAMIKGQILANYGSPALTPLRAAFKTDLREWLGQISKLKQKCVAGEIDRMVSELLTKGSSSVYHKHMTGHIVPVMVNGHWQMSTAAGPIDPDAFDVPEIEQSDLSRVALDTLDSLLKSWLTDDDLVTQLGPATLLAELPSNWGQVPPMPLKIDILVSEHTPETVTISSADYYAVAAGRDQIAALRSSAHSSPCSYLALAVPKTHGLKREEHYDRAPPARFEWWVIDAQAYFASDEFKAHSERVLIPHQNAWNLSMCALLWAAKWVQAFYSPLTLTQVTTVPALNDQIKTVFDAKPDRAQIMATGWDSLTRVLPDARPNIEPADFWRVNFVLGLGTAMQLVCGQLTDQDHSGQTEISTYPPEALYGTISLWLFSRSYHQFMDTARQKHLGSDLKVNQRFLPLKGDDPSMSSRLHRAALWHVVVLYRTRGVDVRVIAEPPEQSHSDRALYGKPIGRYQWITLSPDGAQWDDNQQDAAGRDDYRDFFNKYGGEALVDRNTDEKRFEAFASLLPAALALSLVKPRWLFPAESRFIEHPWLWSAPGNPTSLLRQARVSGQ